MNSEMPSGNYTNFTTHVGNSCLIRPNAVPFFYLADTAWELFHVLTREEARDYFNVRAAQKFNVIQAVVVSEFDGLDAPNAYGELPFFNRDPQQPNENYFETVDVMIADANRLGLVIGLLPTWGSFVTDLQKPGVVVFNSRNARAYGRFLGAHYRTADIIWILGGYRPAEGHEAFWREMAAGLADGGATQLRTYHPNGCHSSADWVHAETWLDFNMIQSCHVERDAPNYAMIERDRRRTPQKPVLDGEPCYEDHPINWKPELGVFSAWDVRRAAWRSVFAGACGIPTAHMAFFNSRTRNANTRQNSARGWPV
jgi:hypothetical protein